MSVRLALDEILTAALVSSAAAIVADTLNNQPVAANPEAMFTGDLLPQLGQLLGLELEQIMALDAVKVIVLGVAIIVFVDAAAVEFKTPQQAGIDELFQRAVDRRAADVVVFAFPGKLIDELVGVEVFVMAEDLFDQVSTLLSLSQPAAEQVFLETLHRSLRYFNRLQRGGCI